MIEIERKFLVLRAPQDLRDYPSTVINQGYLAVSRTDELRIRRRGESHVLTLKSGSGRTRSEKEIELSPQLFEELWPSTEGRRISKIRYEIPYGELTIEFDEYKGSLSGLQTAEVEFPSPAAADCFDPPAWLGQEVTDDPEFKNRALAER